MSRILNQIPMFSALSATALRVSQTNFCASSLISTQLLRRAKKGASGKAATKMVIKPNWRTAQEKKGSPLKKKVSAPVAGPTYPSRDILEKVPRCPPACNHTPCGTRQCQKAWTGRRRKKKSKFKEMLYGARRLAVPSILPFSSATRPWPWG